ncbi:MAG: sigma-54-dependent Fis family transcriptional regulator [Alphaproteobacteria bacterium]|nr:sigma-54-dependent Fis family transcriptional regulator [Alphaproteobacteria bacterium]
MDDHVSDVAQPDAKRTAFGGCVSEGGAARLLVVDDEELIRWSLVEHLRGLGHEVREAENGAVALDAIAADPPELVLLDLKMPGLGGLDVLQRLREREIDLPVVVLTADSTVDSAVDATRLGARTYLTKPFDLEEVGRVVTRILGESRLSKEVVYDARAARPGYGGPDGYIGAAATLQPIFATLDRLERVDAPTVLIMGESGTGKDVIAHLIHTRGPRRRGPFLEVDCAAMPPTLIESELFGHEKGAFTDAREMKRGLFEVAKGGVVFLDELGELPLETQAKLLRALENRTYRRVGGVKQLELDAALVAATNRNLAAEVEAGRFREDLFFRLNVVPLRLPPLRERREDIPALVAHFIDRCNDRFGRTLRGVAGDAMALLQRWTWPGNVRELRNVIERIAILSPDDVIRPEHLPAEIRYARTPSQGVEGCPFVLPEEGVDLDAVEHGLLVQALDRTNGNQSAAARLLGISRYALRYRMEKYDMLAVKED